MTQLLDKISEKLVFSKLECDFSFAENLDNFVQVTDMVLVLL